MTASSRHRNRGNGGGLFLLLRCLGTILAGPCRDDVAAKQAAGKRVRVLLAGGDHHRAAICPPALASPLPGPRAQRHPCPGRADVDPRLILQLVREKRNEDKMHLLLLLLALTPPHRKRGSVAFFYAFVFRSMISFTTQTTHHGEEHLVKEVSCHLFY